MLKIVDKKSFIDKAERKLKDALAPFSDRNEEILIGGPNWHNTREAHWSEELRIWWANYKLENRYENAFGVTEPHWGSGYGHALSCVIDIPFSGINRRIGGAFATEGKELFLLHRGRIGGGRKEIGKTLFMHNYRGNFIVAQDGDLYSTVALVGAMDSEKFPIQLANFVHELQRVKDYRTGRDQPYQAPLPDDFFKEEFTGTKEYSVGQVLSSLRRISLPVKNRRIYFFVFKVPLNVFEWHNVRCCFYFENLH